jgi:hypothetical protein
MRKLITTIASLALVDTSVAIAQTAGSPNPAAPQSTNAVLDRVIKGICRGC